MGHGSEIPAPLATGRHQRLIPDNHLAEWDAAIEEYEAKQRRPDG